jgi:hypothetical protein
MYGCAMKLITHGYELPVTDVSKPDQQMYQKCLATVSDHQHWCENQNEN